MSNVNEKIWFEFLLKDMDIQRVHRLLCIFMEFSSALMADRIILKRVMRY